MQIAIQEDMLPGRTLVEKLEKAKELGFAGIEFWGRHLERRIYEIGDALETTDMTAAAINHGRQSRFLDPNPHEREQALDELRASIRCAADIQAKGVIFVPHFFGALLPDLSPYKSAMQLEAELLDRFLRELSDFAYALGVELYVEPVNRYETHFLNRLEQAAHVTRKINHSSVKIVADVFHMALEEQDMTTAFQAHASDIGHVHLADNNRGLPGQGMLDFAAIGAALKQIGYTGWAAYECGNPGDNHDQAAAYAEAMPASLTALHEAGIMGQSAS